MPKRLLVLALIVLPLAFAAAALAAPPTNEVTVVVDAVAVDTEICADFGFAGGTLGCTGSCLPDVSGCTAGICEDTCEFAGDGECDDGGAGSSFNGCGLGTDCTDCGAR